jgi:hypothetical protein
MSALIIPARFGKDALRTVWNRAVPHGSLFTFCLRPNRNLLSHERRKITEFCNTRFGQANWSMPDHDDHIGFRDSNDMNVFLANF